MARNVLITGSSHGIGAAAAIAFAKEEGANIGITCNKNPEGAEKTAAECAKYGVKTKIYAGDVGCHDHCKAMVEDFIKTFGQIDVLVNNAGFGISGAIEFTETAEAKALFDVNFFGMVNMNRAVVPLMRQAGRGRIVNLSSVAAPVPIPFQAYYSATKAAVNAYTMALANELRPFGVTVCAVMPGDIHTGFTAARRKVSAGDAIYQGRISRSVKRMEHDEETGMDPAKAGAYIASVAMREGHHHPLYAIRFDYKFFTFLAKVLPARFLNWLIYCLYGK